jgi:DNA-binding response OmpR family regulator
MGVLSNGQTPLFSYGDQHLSVDFREQVVNLDGQKVVLRKKEYDLLALLVQRAGQVVRRETLLLQVWGYSSEVRTRTLDVHVRRLRSKMGRYADVYIETIFGIGYRFQPFIPNREDLTERESKGLAARA